MKWLSYQVCWIAEHQRIVDALPHLRQTEIFFHPPHLDIESLTLQCLTVILPVMACKEKLFSPYKFSLTLQTSGSSCHCTSYLIILAPLKKFAIQYYFDISLTIQYRNNIFKDTACLSFLKNKFSSQLHKFHL